MEQYQDQKLLETSGKGNIPAFLTKLWKIVADQEYDELISWNENGTTIKIHEPVNFSQEILPKFYKHNNFSSFVRQVNMYGFRKIIDVTGAKHGDGDWEFYHTYFQRDHPENIAMMKRKGQIKEETKMNSTQFTNLLQDVEKLKSQHDAVDEKLKLVKVENERLWREVFDLRERHQNQQTMIVKLIQFFLQLVMNKTDASRKRRYPVEEEIPENVYFNKRALHLSDKGKKMAIQCYDSPTSSLTEVMSKDPSISKLVSSTTLQQEQLKEIAQIASTVEVVDEATKQRTTISSVDDILKLASSYGQSSSTASNSKSGSSKISSPTSPFIFPEAYKPEPEIIDLSSCISTDESNNILNPINPILYSLKTATPEMSSFVKKVQGGQTLSTPVVNMPTSALTRQTSFRDRDEVSANVDKISKSIETLQDMLNKQEINLDLKGVNINSLYNEVPSKTSFQDLLKMVHQQTGGEPLSEESESLFSSKEPDEHEVKMIPYAEAFSPSNLIDPEYGNVNVVDDDSNNPFFESVLQHGDEEEEDEDII